MPMGHGQHEHVITDAHERVKIMQKLITSTIAICLLTAMSISADAQSSGTQNVSTPAFSWRLNLPKQGSIFHNELPPQTTYTQPDGSTYVSYDYARSWRLVVKGSGTLPTGVKPLPVSYPNDRFYSKNGVDYESYNGGRTYWMIGASKPTSTQTLPRTAAASDIPKIVSIVPNPTTGLTMLTLNVPSVTQVSITLCDQTGKVLITAFNGSMSGGSIELPIDASKLLSGAYMVRLQTDAGSTTSKFIIAH